MHQTDSRVQPKLRQIHMLMPSLSFLIHSSHITQVFFVFKITQSEKNQN